MNTYKHLTPYKRPDSYIGADWFGYYTVAGRNRESDILSNSNWECWVEFMTKLLGPEGIPIGVDESGDDVYHWVICRESHWACGWIELIRVHESVGHEILTKIDEQLRRLDGYPVFNDDHFSAAEMREYERCWRERGADRDFRREVRKAFEEECEITEELTALLDRLDDVPVDTLIELHERLIPSGEFHHDGWPCIDISVANMTWDDLESVTNYEKAN